MRRRTFEIFTDNFKMCNFVNGLSRQGKKFSITPWSSSDRSEAGFVVWYYR